MSDSAFRLRDYREGDEAAAFHVCMKTGDHGGDGEPFFREDPDALGRIYVAPYVRFEPDLAVFLEDDEGVCGYALAARDSKSFYRRYDREIRPGLVSRFPWPTGDPKTWNRIEETYGLYHSPDYFVPEPYEQYPAHLHIDLLPHAQGEGWGRRMIGALLDRLRRCEVAGVHLGMSGSNRAAYGFYRHLGFEELMRTGAGADESIYLGMKFLDLG